jgi:hypothetical protein
VTVVVISSSGKGDRTAGSLDVKVSGGRTQSGQIHPGRRATWQAAAIANQEAPKVSPRVKWIAGYMGMPNRSIRGEGPGRMPLYWTNAAPEFPGVVEGGMPRRNAQRKPGTTRGSPRPWGTAQALRISRHAVKSRCAREWGGWGRLSVEGPRQHNLDRSEGPWGRTEDRPHGGARRVAVSSTLIDEATRDDRMHEGREQTGRRDTWAPPGKTSSDMPALEPYRGKPAVRNLRGGDGNVGIIRSPVRAIALPDHESEARAKC